MEFGVVQDRENRTAAVVDVMREPLQRGAAEQEHDVITGLCVDLDPGSDRSSGRVVDGNQELDVTMLRPLVRRARGRVGVSRAVPRSQ
mgnify:CR=1 FL=1